MSTPRSSPHAIAMHSGSHDAQWLALMHRVYCFPIRTGGVILLHLVLGGTTDTAIVHRVRSSMPQYAR
ncbi:hypothetical protein V496_01692 [Pseudogymnoascus sp. VKM F-4515 (FW-2607)]|nr:hypothetical protein V496_01692 [Pseudogymnoascus sp. VKM F-4515 (FW-2607)]